MKTSKKEFEIFKSECEKWIEFFGLKNYSIIIQWQELDEDTDAEIDVGELINQCATITFNTIKFVRKDVFTTEYIKRVAFHEVCHLLFWRYDKYATYRYTTKQNLVEAEHEIIRRLENSIFKLLNK